LRWFLPNRVQSYQAVPRIVIVGSRNDRFFCGFCDPAVGQFLCIFELDTDYNGFLPITIFCPITITIAGGLTARAAIICITPVITAITALCFHLWIGYLAPHYRPMQHKPK
jgi:hypothetical protein